MFLEQFIHFTTDIVGLERTLRLVQSTLLVIISCPELLALVASLSLRGSGDAAAASVAEGKAAAVSIPHVRGILAGVLDQVNLVRRVMRAFRFVESFYRAYHLFGAIGAAKKEEGTAKTAERWLDAVSASFLGMYLGLEFLILPDMLGVPGLHAWEPATARLINTEALRFWLFALAGNALANILRIYKIFRDVPLPESTEEEKQANSGSPLLDEKEDGGEVVNEKESLSKDKKLEALRLERERLKRISKAHMRKLRTRRRALHTRFSMLARKTAADILDITIPGTVVGWVHVQPGTVGLVMLVTTFLTGYEVWKRCGADVAARRANA